MTDRVARVAWAGSGILARWRAEAYAALVVLAVPVALYLALYAPIPAVHDALHHLRHSVWGVPCH